MTEKMERAKRLLSRFIYASAPDESGEWRAYCPLCEDPGTSKTPSAALNFDAEVWHCMSCGNGGLIRSLLGELRRRRRGADVIDIRTGKQQKPSSSTPKKPLPTSKEIAGWHARLMKHDRLLAYMTDIRGLTRDTLKEFEVGHDGFRYTIPVRNTAGQLVNVRRYNPQRKDHMKMISWAGYGQARIFRPDLLEDYSEVLLCEGEWDMMVAHQMGLPAITHTAGALTFNTKWAAEFKDKVVFICYDVDQTGERGSKKAARILAPVAQSVHIIRLDIDIKGGDITDFFIGQGRSLEEFMGIMEHARRKSEGKQRSSLEATTTGLPVSLVDSQNTAYGSTPLEMVVTVAGKKSPAYVAPKTIEIKCDMDKGPVCTQCPMMVLNGNTIQRIAATDRVLLSFTDSNERNRKATLRDISGARCSDHIEYDITEEWTIEELQVTNSVKHRGFETQTPLSRPVYNVGAYDTPVNITARVVGRQYHSPQDGRGVFLSWHLEQTQTDLDKFKVTPELVERLRIFRKRKGQSPLDRCLDIVKDLSYNVTNIYQRDELHLAYDLVWHSVLSFDFHNSRLDKGWLEMCVVGDTRTGKSEVAIQLAKHYNCGEVKSCEGMTFAGLVGGVQQMGKHWMVTWGTIPLNDRRLIVLDEVTGIKDKDVIESMSSIRSSGRAQLTKIATDEASARTRLIWIANPPDGRAMREINAGGMEVIAQLVPNPEDIARFDFAMSVASDDVPTSVINTMEHNEVRHQFTDELCSDLVMWAWSRKPEQVYWMEGVERLLLAMADDVGSRYVPDPPLVQGANIRTKLARIAVAIAARTFSTDSSGELVIVQEEHVHDAVRFLDMLYGQESFGYQRHSRRAIRARTEAEQKKQEARKYLAENADTIRHTLLSVGSHTFKTRDFEEIGAMYREDAQVAVRTLLEMRMIRRLAKGSMRMEPALIDLLKEVEDKDADDGSSNRPRRRRHG